MKVNDDPSAETNQIETRAVTGESETGEGGDRVIGKMLGGRYLVERELGRGGMGVVYLARDKPELHSRPVVVKVLLEEALKNQMVVTKFYQEIESLTRLDDPGVIGIFDAGRLEGGAPYLVMQYVEGTTLRAAIKREGMDLEQTAAILRQVGRSVSAAHDAGILHRDLKPENIMLRRTASGEQQVKIIDFGIAKVKNSMSGPSPISGFTVGTIGYMSPEQLGARPLTPASDIYSLGVIAYEMITGRNPFNPDSVFQLLEMQRAGVRVKPGDLRPSISDVAQEIILKALAFDPHERFQRAQEFGDRLSATLVSGHEPGERTTRRLTPGRSGRQSDLPPTVAAALLPGEKAERSKPTLETAHVLFMDIVNYSTMLIDEQSEQLQQLQEIVRASPEFQKAQLAGQLLRLPTGDGMALSFFGDPEAPVRCAVEVSKALREPADIKLRMGVHSGLVYRINDISENMNIAGGGINFAQCVMDCGDAGHILLSKRVADDLGQLSRWSKDLHDLGEAEGKHGARVQLYNFYNEEIGNSKIPARLSRAESVPKPKTIGRWLVAAAAVILIGSALFLTRSFWKPGQPAAENPATIADAGQERGFTYFLTPSERTGDGEEKRFAGNEQFRNNSKFKFVLIPEQPGSLYLINKGSGANRNPVWNVLFPTPAKNNGSSSVAARQRLEVGIYFDRFSGNEDLSIIWSAQPVPELEAICRDASRTDFEIRSPAQIETVAAFLKQHQSPATWAGIDNEKKHTTVRGRGEILVSKRVLEHISF